MPEEKKKKIARTIQDLYLYSTRENEDSLLRTFAWTVSWVVGVALQSSSGPQALGGAFFVFSLSLLIEFVPEKKETTWGRALYTLFCSLLGYIFIVSLPLIFSDSVKASSWWGESVYIVGWVAFGLMWLREILSMIEIHKQFYDEEMERRRIENEEKMRKEKENQELFQAFLNSLQGTPNQGGKR